MLSASGGLRLAIAHQVATGSAYQGGSGDALAVCGRSRDEPIKLLDQISGEADAETDWFSFSSHWLSI